MMNIQPDDSINSDDQKFNDLDQTVDEPLILNDNSIDCGSEALFYDFADSPSVSGCAPFYHKFKGFLFPNDVIIIDLTVADNANSFTVDLSTNKVPADSNFTRDLLLHVNPRLDINCVVRNSYLSGIWGREERKSDRKCPFRKGKSYVIEIFVAADAFLIAVNGIHFCSFVHRSPYRNISVLEINGDAVVNKVKFHKTDHYPVEDFESFLKMNPSLEIPYLSATPSVPFDKRKLILQGTVQLLPSTFYINLQSSRFYYPHPRVSFHMSVRWRPFDCDKIVFNSYTNGQWLEEEVYSMNDAFQPGRDFCIFISPGPRGYNVAVDKFVFPLFLYRVNPEDMNFLCIGGDVKLKSVRWIT